jgi:glycerophosphoryl diester phosphodiesterase
MARPYSGILHTVTRPRTGLPFLDWEIERPGAVLAFAHRGGAGHPELSRLENTLAAFRHAVSLGYTYLETDAHATSDGVLLAFHDRVLDRVTGSVGSIAETAYVDLRTAMVAGREPIPRLVDLLEELPAARFNVDLKSDAAVGPLAELVERTGAHDRVCVGAFSERRLRDFRRRVSRRVATSYGPVGVGLSRYAPGFLSARVLAGGGDALQVPLRHRGMRILTAGFLARAHAAGKPVHVWTVDDPAEMHSLLDLGVDGLITDRTDLLREVLVARGQWAGTPR